MKNLELEYCLLIGRSSVGLERPLVGSKTSVAMETGMNILLNFLNPLPLHDFYFTLRLNI